MHSFDLICLWFYQNVVGNLVASAITTAAVWVKMHRHHKKMEQKMTALHKALRIEE